MCDFLSGTVSLHFPFFLEMGRALCARFYSFSCYVFAFLDPVLSLSLVLSRLVGARRSAFGADSLVSRVQIR